MSAFDIHRSLERARLRELPGEGRKRRRDRGSSRFPPAVEQCLTELLHGVERPSFTEVHRELEQRCARLGLPVPTRSSLYNAVERVAVPHVRWDALPDEVKRSLYNVAPEHPGEQIPGDQVVFFAFNHGDPRALSHAAGMPWLCLVRAEQRRGWRTKSLSLLRAVMRFRGLG